MSEQARLFYEFGPFRLEVAERRLLRAGEPVSLPPKAFDTLLLLVERRGHVVKKDEIISRLWPDTFVEENNLTQYISLLRKALGDGRDGGRYIETVPRWGYRFADGGGPAAAEVLVQKQTRAHPHPRGDGRRGGRGGDDGNGRRPDGGWRPARAAPPPGARDPVRGTGAGRPGADAPTHRRPQGRRRRAARCAAGHQLNRRAPLQAARRAGR